MLDFRLISRYDIFVAGSQGVDATVFYLILGNYFNYSHLCNRITPVDIFPKLLILLQLPVLHADPHIFLLHVLSYQQKTLEHCEGEVYMFVLCVANAILYLQITVLFQQFIHAFVELNAHNLCH